MMCLYRCRYWAVTNIDYVHQRTGRRIGLMISIVWIFSFSVSIAPMLGWKDPDWNKRLDDLECLVSQDVYYQIFATASSFYVPLLVILVLYWRIFQTARKRIRRRQQVIKNIYNFHIIPQRQIRSSLSPISYIVYIVNHIYALNYGLPFNSFANYLPLLYIQYNF